MQDPQKFMIKCLECLRSGFMIYHEWETMPNQIMFICMTCGNVEIVPCVEETDKEVEEKLK